MYTILSPGSHYTPNIAPAMKNAGHFWTGLHGAYRQVRRQLADEGQLSYSTEITEAAKASSITEVIRLPDGSIKTSSLLQQVCSASFLEP